MPLTEKGSEIKAAMNREYGEKKGEQVFYASKNAGKITGVDNAPSDDASDHWTEDCSLSEIKSHYHKYAPK